MSLLSPSPTLRVAAVQCSILWNDVEGNCQRIRSYVAQHAHEAELIIFPETITTGFSAEAAQLADEDRGEVYTLLTELAKEYQVGIAGSYLTRASDGKIYNMFFLIDEQGQMQRQRYGRSHSSTSHLESVYPRE